jgi:hypothetical protein
VKPPIPRHALQVLQVVRAVQTIEHKERKEANRTGVPAYATEFQVQSCLDVHSSMLLGRSSWSALRDAKIEQLTPFPRMKDLPIDCFGM